MKKLTALLFFCILNTGAFAAEISFDSAYTSPNNLESTSYGATISESIQTENNHKINFLASYKFTDFNDTAKFMPSNLTIAETGIDVTGPEYMMRFRIGSASDKPFQRTQNDYAYVAASKKVWESGANGVHLGLIASSKPILRRDYYFLPLVSYSYKTPELYLELGSFNIVRWKASENVTLEGLFSIMGHGKLRATYRWSKDFSTSLVYANILDTYYLSRDYPRKSYLKMRTASVSAEAEKKFYDYAKLVVSAGAITSARYYILDSDDKVLNDQKVKSGFIGSAQMVFMF